MVQPAGSAADCAAVEDDDALRTDSRAPMTAGWGRTSSGAGTRPGQPELCQAELELDRLYLRSARRLVSLCVLVVILCQLDANNLAYAALTFNRDLHLDGEIYGLGSSMFFVTFALFQVPANLVMLRTGVRVWLGCLMIAWGIVAACFALVRSTASFLALRLLLGALQSGVNPAMWFHLTQFFPQDRLTKPYAAMACGILIAAIIGAPLATGLLALEGVGGLKGWQWLYIVEGIPPVLVGFALLLYLPADLYAARWLSESERALVLSDMAHHRQASPPLKQIPRDPRQLLAMVLRNPLVPYVCCCGFIIGLAGYIIIFFGPILVNAVLSTGSLARASAAAGPGQQHLLPMLLNAVPFMVAVGCTWGLAHSAQQRQELFLHCGLGKVAAGIMFLVVPLMAASSPAGGFAGLILLVAFYSAANGLTVPLVAFVGRGPAQVVALPVYMTVANLGGVAGPSFAGALLKRTGGFNQSLPITGALLVVCGVALSLLRVIYPWYQRRAVCAAGGLPVTSSGSDAAAAGSSLDGSDAGVQLGTWHALGASSTAQGDGAPAARPAAATQRWQ